MFVGGYLARLWCDHPGHPREGSEGGGAACAEFSGENRADCVRQARRAGWTFRRDGTLTCPKCRKRPLPPATRGDGPAVASDWYSPQPCPECCSNLRTDGRRHWCADPSCGHHTAPPKAQPPAARAGRSWG